MQISEQWAYAQIPVIYKNYELGARLRPSLIPQLFRVETSTRSKEEHFGVGGMDPAAWGMYETTGRVSETDFNQGYLATFTPKEYPVDLVIERKLFDDDQYGVLRDGARRLGISSFQKREADAASVFNNATSASFLGPDGVALLSNSHPMSPVASGTTQDNLYALTLTAANVSTLRTAMLNFTDDVGNKLSLMPDTVLVPIELEDTAIKQLRSPQDPSSANNTTEPQSGRYNIVVWNQLTDTNRWFLIDSVQMRENLIWYNRVLPEFTFAAINQVRVAWHAYMRYSYGWTDWRWVIGSEPS